MEKKTFFKVNGEEVAGVLSEPGEETKKDQKGKADACYQLTEKAEEIIENIGKGL